MKKYPHIVVTEINKPKLEELETIKDVNIHYTEISELNITVWGFSDKADLFEFISTYPSIMRNFELA